MTIETCLSITQGLCRNPARNSSLSPLVGARHPSLNGQSPMQRDRAPLDRFDRSRQILAGTARWRQRFGHFHAFTPEESLQYSGHPRGCLASSCDDRATASRLERIVGSRIGRPTRCVDRPVCKNNIPMVTAFPASMLYQIFTAPAEVDACILDTQFGSLI